MSVFLLKYEKKNEGLNFQNWVFNDCFNQITWYKTKLTYFYIELRLLNQKVKKTIENK